MMQEWADYLDRLKQSREVLGLNVEQCRWI
jgi:hypothetical protein